MDTFPLTPELMQAFPLGALNLLVAVASTVAAQHGVEPARRLCSELAGNEEFWRYIGTRLDGNRSDEAPNTERDPVPVDELPQWEAATDAPDAVERSPVPSVAGGTAGAELDLSTSGPLGESAPARTRRKSRRRRSTKANGSGP